MDTEVNEIPRRTWAPFVGAALAALTAGSLVVFSLVAQRTSLDGFTNRGITATERGSDPSPSSITIAPVDDGSGAAESAPSPATSLLEVAQVTTPLSEIAAALNDTAALTESASDASASAAPEGRFPADELLLASRAGGGSPDRDGERERVGADARHEGKQTHKSHEAKMRKTKGERGRGRGHDKARGRGHDKARGRGHDKARGRGHDKARGRGHDKARGRGHDKARGRGHDEEPGRGRSSAAPQPTPAPSSRKPAAKSQNSSGSPPAHSNAGGNGRSRGRGHKKH